MKQLLMRRQENILISLMVMGTILMSFALYKTIAERFVEPEQLQQSSSEWQAGGQIEFPFQFPGIEKTSVTYKAQKQDYPIRIPHWRGFMAIFKVPVEKLKIFSIPGALAEKDFSEGLAEIFFTAMTSRGDDGTEVFSEVGFFVKTAHRESPNSEKTVQLLHPLIELVNSESEISRGVFLYHHPKVLSQVSTQQFPGSLQYNVELGQKFLMSISGLAVVTAHDAMVESLISSQVENKLFLSKFDMEHRDYGDSIAGGEIKFSWGTHPLAVSLRNVIGDTKPHWYRYVADGYGLLSKIGTAGSIMNSDKRNY